LHDDASLGALRFAYNILRHLPHAWSLTNARYGSRRNASPYQPQFCCATNCGERDTVI
jgi:hypothetical protein